MKLVMYHERLDAVVLVHILKNRRIKITCGKTNPKVISEIEKELKNINNFPHYFVKNFVFLCEY